MTLAKSLNMQKSRIKNKNTIALACASLILLMAIGQLVSFEKFIPIIESYLLPGGHATAVAVACLVAASEVFALPFLLGMKLNSLMRTVSMVAGWVFVAIWLILTIWSNVAVNEVFNVGFLGAHFDLPVGWWSVLLTAAVGVIIAWVAYLAVPASRSNHKRHK